jgi:DNA-directed RNA polymerase specialized sigma24 family protein
VREPTPDDAWDGIVAIDREQGQRLYGYTLRLGIDPGRAADLVQEALLRLWRELGRGTVIMSREAWTYRRGWFTVHLQTEACRRRRVARDTCARA